MEKLATLCTRKTQYFIDFSKKDAKKLIVKRARPTGELEVIAEIPMQERSEVLKVLASIDAFETARQRVIEDRIEFKNGLEVSIEATKQAATKPAASKSATPQRPTDSSEAPIGFKGSSGPRRINNAKKGIWDAGSNDEETPAPKQRKKKAAIWG